MTTPGLGLAPRFNRTARWRSACLLTLLSIVISLASCATAPPAPQVQRLTAQVFAPSQTVDLLDAPPAAPYLAIARLQVADPTGTAARDQLIAQLVQAAKSLGAQALVIEQVQREDSARIAFDPAGGQMQGGPQVTSMTVSALAIRYSR
jgi:hypothetical protein